MIRLRVLAIALLCSGCVQASRADPLLGVWRVRQLETRTRDSVAVNPSPHPGQAIFTRSHYSLTWIPGQTNMREFRRPWIPTDSEKIRRYGEIVVNSGTYEIEHDTLIVLRPLVSRVPEFMGGGKLIYGYHVKGDTLWLASLDEYSRDGVQAPWASAGTRVTITFVRVER